MNRIASRSLKIVASIGFAILALVGIVEYNFEDYRIHKIEFIVWDNQHDNIAAFSREQFIDYVQYCGARVEASSPQWNVRFDGLFKHRTWSFPFVTDTTPSQQSPSPR